jgi:hypothetical protein
MSYNIEIEPAHFNVSPLLFYTYARQYLDCETAFKPTAPRSSPVPYFLLCRAIELAVKAIHLQTMRRVKTAGVKGVKEEFSHRIKDAYDRLPEVHRTLDATEYAGLERANEIYRDKGFEYTDVYHAVTALSGFPDLDALRDMANKVFRACKPDEA